MKKELKFKKYEVYKVTRTLSTHAAGKVRLVGDDGVYFMSGGKVDPNDNPIAYAEGCNPKVDEFDDWWALKGATWGCLLYTSPSPRDQRGSRMPSSA